jgi:hypothetical protein
MLHGAELLVFNAAGLTSDSVAVPLSSGWSAVGNASSPKGWRYRSTDLSSPVRSVLVEADKIVVKAGAASFGYTVDEPMQGSVGVRLLLGQIAWCATAPAKATGNPPSTARNDTVDRFVAEPKTPPPSSCPPLPQ